MYRLAVILAAICPSIKGDREGVHKFIFEVNDVLWNKVRDKNTIEHQLGSSRRRKRRRMIRRRRRKRRSIVTAVVER